ncbi:hypothetical protein N7G274_009826 [Stereocaulon virgatum]|uniref:RING-type E3 ubiquitin transferase n=1 Tax=Stereocaulon virgatum TaxID=373712 RepID=A0ABR3ZXB6_9LECA
MRFAAYTGTSMVLATGVIIRALHERANFYSACVYLAQSNACLMVLTNVALLGVCTSMLGLQRLFYGQLRPIEVEQLYEKAWFAITETCLAMTIFREEVGGWFLVMFVCLLIGKVWGWIGEGRVEILEQQPPSNPRLFHARLSISLIISTLLDVLLLRYSIITVLRHARPNMMVMFAFEFAVLTITSISTAARYTISLHEASVISRQIKDRRAQMRRQREELQSRSATSNQPTITGAQTNTASADDDIDSLDVDVPGWEEKGRWVFYLDLATDFFKLVLYLTFFCVLCIFYGMPIHIIRDVALTIRSFYKRITDFIRYRQATRDMNARYPDATAEEVTREDVCIICREDMRPWQQSNAPEPHRPENVGAAPAATPVVDERLRPKKLPCGHILHFACLRSWLERQQNCPTCRRPVLVTGRTARNQEQHPANQNGRAQPQANQPQVPLPLQGNLPQPVVAQNVFNLGPLRIAFGARQIHGHPPQANNDHPPHNQQGQLPLAAQMPHVANAFGIQRQAPGVQTRTFANFTPTNLQSHIHQLEQQLTREINGLRVQQSQLQLVRALQGELTRLRIAHMNPDTNLNVAPTNQSRYTDTLPQAFYPGNSFSPISQQQSLGTGHPSLPAGITLPPGWTVLPLQRLDDERSTNRTQTGITGSSDPQAQSLDSNSVSPSASTKPPSMAQLHHSYTTEVPIPESSSSKSGVTPERSEAGNGTSKSASGFRGDPSTNILIPNSGLNDGTKAESYEQHVDGAADSSIAVIPPQIPQWGSSTDIASANRSQEPKTPEGIDESGRAVESMAESTQSKGKGKASTVEDFTEDLD